jgi:hypothetical protein
MDREEGGSHLYLGSFRSVHASEMLNAWGRLRAIDKGVVVCLLA